VIFDEVWPSISGREVRAASPVEDRGDGAAEGAFLKIMRGFELTWAKRDLYVGLLRSRAFPVQIIWGEADRALKVTTFGEIARRAAGLDHIHRLPGKHFLQEDQSPALAELITAQARP
jgi:pimeloyl-ACP methyl ester carboxylesterase